MAVVFISPKSRQKMFFMGITIIVVLFLLVVSLVIFLAKPKAVSPELVFNKPKVEINTKIFDSDQFKSFQPFTEMETQYSYKAKTKDDKIQTGFISAVSDDQARLILTSMDLSVLEIKEAEIGRENPFLPYYQLIAPKQNKK